MKLLFAPLACFAEFFKALWGLLYLAVQFVPWPVLVGLVVLVLVALCAKR